MRGTWAVARARDRVVSDTPELRSGFPRLPLTEAQDRERREQAQCPRAAVSVGETPEPEAAVGVMYELGQGVAQDYAQALAWYRKAADQGNAGAQINLGDMYRDGHGVPQDYVRAHMWYNLAASQGRGATQRDDMAAKMVPAQIAEALRLAGEWVPNK
jgi:TPR repeat protein